MVLPESLREGTNRIICSKSKTGFLFRLFSLIDHRSDIELFKRNVERKMKLLESRSKHPQIPYHEPCALWLDRLYFGATCKMADARYPERPD